MWAFNPHCQKPVMCTSYHHDAVHKNTLLWSYRFCLFVRPHQPPCRRPSTALVCVYGWYSLQRRCFPLDLRRQHAMWFWLFSVYIADAPPPAGSYRFAFSQSTFAPLAGLARVKRLSSEILGDEPPVHILVSQRMVAGIALAYPDQSDYDHRLAIAKTRQLISQKVSSPWFASTPPSPDKPMGCTAVSIRHVIYQRTAAWQPSHVQPY